MKFRIERTSTYFEYAKPPVPEAVPGPHDNDRDRPTWEIEIGTLDDLLALIKAHGKVVVRGPDPDDGEDETCPHRIEIYDDWRE